MFASEPVSRLSTQMTRWPSPRSASQRWEPRKPAPPVTTEVGTAAILTVLFGGLRGRLQNANGSAKSGSVARQTIADGPGRVEHEH